jgi:hypothetical protein
MKVYIDGKEAEVDDIRIAEGGNNILKFDDVIFQSIKNDIENMLETELPDIEELEKMIEFEKMVEEKGVEECSLIRIETLAEIYEKITGKPNALGNYVEIISHSY